MAHRLFVKDLGMRLCSLRKGTYLFLVSDCSWKFLQNTTGTEVECYFCSGLQRRLLGTCSMADTTSEPLYCTLNTTTQSYSLQP